MWEHSNHMVCLGIERGLGPGQWPFWWPFGVFEAPTHGCEALAELARPLAFIFKGHIFPVRGPLLAWRPSLDPP